MKLVYPVILTPASEGSFSGYAVYVPILGINTQGESIADAVSMAGEARGEARGRSFCFLQFFNLHKHYYYAT